ncbi:MAG: hypothetical protein H7070_05820 [Saprospiraceae bacterium]|nr:hypothetical protein [Pyrinomonadaceae bacterium]
MTSEEITQYLTELNDELRLMDIKGEISLYGGAVMCLAFKSRPATKDVDAIFEPVKMVRNAARKVGERHGLDVGWLNLAVKMFVVEHPRKVVFDFSNLKVFVPEGDYMLAMKVLSARPDSADIDDIRFLIDYLKLNTVEDVLGIVREYYPKKEVKSETVFLIEGLFEQ